MRRESGKRRPVHRTAEAVDRIRGLIEEGALRPGDKIPPERELSQTLHVSRDSLRSATGYLAAMGVVNVRCGVGSYVSDRAPELGKQYFELMGALYSFSSWQILEAHLNLGPHLAGLAAQRRKKSHLSALAEEMLAMYASAECCETFLKHLANFQRLIARAAGNPVLGMLEESVISALYESEQIVVRLVGNPQQIAEISRDVYKAIQTSKAAEASALTELSISSLSTAESLTEL